MEPPFDSDAEFSADPQMADEDSHEVYRLYTPAMLAELVNVPARAVRRWYRQGYLQSQRDVGRLPYFDFSEVATARHLATLLRAGCSPSEIDRKLEELSRSLPGSERPLCDPSVVVSGRQLMLRRGEDLTEPGGQLLIDFEAEDQSEEYFDSVLPVAGGLTLKMAEEGKSESILSAFDQLHFEALKWEDQGELQRAAEVYRTLLMARPPSAELHFALADLLYRMGDLPAARERYYAAIEIDETYVEARASLGCLLAESGELDLAVAAFQGALAFHPNYPDVHYHLANVLIRLGEKSEAEHHWREFLDLAPESPWADMARERLSSALEESGILLTT